MVASKSPRWIMLSDKKLSLCAVLFFFCVGVGAAHFESEEPGSLRESLKLRIKTPGIVGNSLKAMGNWAGSLTPAVVKRGLDAIGSSSFEMLLNNPTVRSMIETNAFAQDNQIYTQYDAQFGAFKSIPDQGIEAQLIIDLLETASHERKHWENGRMSGAIYDGSPEHMKRLAEAFRAAVLYDERNRFLFDNDQQALECAAKAFEYFNTSNPLHGTSFPLAVKAMREMGAMFASLFGRETAIVSSGGHEALRIGLRALKPQLNNKKLIIIGDQYSVVKNVSKTLNLSSDDMNLEDKIEIDDDAGAVAIYVTYDDLNSVNDICLMLQKKRIKTHIHFASDVFQNIIARKISMNELFARCNAIDSVSFDTDQIIYSGISAVVFRDAQARFLALESHIDWIGGMYPGINAAGSIAGIDYILAYLMVLYHGRDKLADFAENASKNVSLEQVDKNDPDEFATRVVSQFYAPLGVQKEPLIAKNLAQLEDGMVKLLLSLYKASPEHFYGHMTSGGTESIRRAMHVYADAWRARNHNARPIFLMTKSAHVAFERHLKDIDAIIIRVEHMNDFSMDPDDLVKKIAHYGAMNIAGIVGSTPSYPFGVYDDIKSLAAIAHNYNIPFHLDACLGSWVNQFPDESPAFVNLGSDEMSGITSWSADPHKYGGTQKGLSFVGFRKNFFPQYEQQVNICAPRSYSQLSVGLHGLLAIGYEGYSERAKNIAYLGESLFLALQKVKELELITGEDISLPHFVLAFRLKGDLKPLTYTFASFMKVLGWHLSQVGEHAVHIALTNAHTYDPQFLTKFMDDASHVIELLKAHPDLIKSSNVAVYGAAADMDFSALTSGQQLTSTMLKIFVKLYAENLITVAQ